LDNYLFHPSKIIISKPIFLEIGFGMGHNLLHTASNNKNNLIIGVDPFLNGVASVIEKCVEDKINNILIYPHPVEFFFEKFKKIFFEKIFILFPDPWPKKKHYKRRLFKNKFIITLLERLNAGGKIYFATDNQSYYNQALEELEIVKQTIPINIEKLDNNELVLTKYFKRAKKLGNNVNFFVIVKL